MSTIKSFTPRLACTVVATLLLTSQVIVPGLPSSSHSRKSCCSPSVTSRNTCLTNRTASAMSGTRSGSSGQSPKLYSNGKYRKNSEEIILHVIKPPDFDNRGGLPEGITPFLQRPPAQPELMWPPRWRKMTYYVSQRGETDTGRAIAELSIMPGNERAKA